MKKFCFAVLLIVISGSVYAQESLNPQITKAFSDAGIPLLRQKVSPQNFSLTVAAPLGMIEKTISLKQLEGKVVFLNFWATWCGPCRSEMPSMEALYARYKDRGLEIISVNCRESNQEVIAFMGRYKLTFPAILDLDGRVSSAYGIQAIPATYIIDRDGKIIARKVGSINWDSPRVRAAFDLLL